VGDFIFSDYYLQISTALPTTNIYGLGERVYKFNLGPNGTYSLLTKDSPDPEDGTPGNNNYGYHPVYLSREKSNKFFHMNLLRSSSPMDVQIQAGKTLTYKVMGGIFDFHYFLGDSSSSQNQAEIVVKQYHQYLGGWTLQPFWAFGYHQCRYGYKSVQELEEVLRNFTIYQLPMDSLWSDIYYMDSYVDFTMDVNHYPPDQMRKLFSAYKKRWTPIIDAGIAINNSVHNIGLKNNIFVQDPNGTYVEGQVWPGKVNYPDFFNPNTSLFWHLGLRKLYQQVNFSGIWLDMNEVSNFVPGETGFVPDPSDLLNNPPYKVSKSTEAIYNHTMRMDAVHYGGVREYLAHNIFGFLEAKATFNFLKTISDLVFILTRATFYGSGQFAAHWTGDNTSDFNFMALSIPGLMSFGLFGIPMTGADICGFRFSTTPELCARWFQLGTLYPFARDHNGDWVGQEPYALGPTVLETARVSLNLRYSILKHYYSLFLKQNGTGTVFRPVFFEFPQDENLYDPGKNYTDTQFLIGDSLLVAPVLSQGQENVKVYFPNDTWYDFINGTLMTVSANIVNYPAPLNTTVPIFIRGGHIVAVQNVTNVTRTDDLSNIYQLVIAFQNSTTPGTYVAQGNLVGIQNFDDQNVLLKCKKANCLYSLSAIMTITGKNYTLTVSFTTKEDLSLFENVGVSSLLMMGDWPAELGMAEGNERLSKNVIKYQFLSPFNVKPGGQIHISSTAAAAALIEL